MRYSVLIILFLLAATFVHAQDEDTLKKDSNSENITWNPAVYDFNEIPKGKPVKATFEYVNKGQDDIHITKVVSSCGCTVAEFSANPVKAGESTKLTATFDAAKFGAFNKLITVYMSDENHYKLYLKGTVGSKPSKAGKPE